MVKRSHSFKKRRSFKKRTTKRSSKYARRQQKAAMTWVRKKYTKVFPVEIAANANESTTTISIIGGRNATAPANTITIADVNQNNNIRTDMTLYQFFRIRGLAFKIFFPMPTDVPSSPVQWSIGYSANEVMWPSLPAERLQTLSTYQTGSCNQNKPISRFYNTATTYRRFGIQYCDTEQFNAGQFGSNPPVSLYGDQLQANQGSSVNVKVYRQESSATGNTIGRLQVTYYVTYKGTKGTSSLIAP